MPKKKTPRTAKKAARKATKKTATKVAARNRAEGKTQISISLPADLVAKIDRLAEAENRNRSNFIATELEKL